jgi:solute carrier family 25 (mitochondrial oxoglutarate transporter), member 11
MPYKGFIDCFAKSIKNEGVLGLWVGLPTYYSRIAPHAMITVLLQDLFHDLLSAKKH